ncbi:MAG: DUF1844 domain-containing protein [Gemmatimonadales bacterium]
MTRPSGGEFRTFLASVAATAAATLHHVEQLLDPKPAAEKAEAGKPDAAEQIRTGLATSQQLIDTLAMLEEKTKGNLTADEDQFLRSALAELRISYVRVLDRSRAGSKT